MKAMEKAMSGVKQDILNQNLWVILRQLQNENHCLL